jgi:hypothetical protein
MQQDDWSPLPARFSRPAGHPPRQIAPAAVLAESSLIALAEKSSKEEIRGVAASL